MEIIDRTLGEAERAHQQIDIGRTPLMVALTLCRQFLKQTYPYASKNAQKF